MPRHISASTNALNSVIVTDNPGPVFPALTRRFRWVHRVRAALGTLPPLQRRLIITVSILAALITVMGILLVVGAFRDDQAIERHMGYANADVLSVTFDRTVVRFTSQDGTTHIPVDGALYPQGLQVGQLVRVEYDTTQPDALVRIAGRNFTLAFLPVGTIICITWIIAVPLCWWLRRTGLRRSALSDTVG